MTIAFDKFEELAYEGDTPLHRALQDCIVVARALEHKLDDPHYMYASNRITRGAIISRNMLISKLEKENKTLKESVKELLTANKALVEGVPVGKTLPTGLARGE